MCVTIRPATPAYLPTLLRFEQGVIEALVRWCREQGLTELSLEVYSRNEAAIAAYAKAGFVGHQLQMRRGIAGG